MSESAWKPGRATGCKWRWDGDRTGTTKAGVFLYRCIRCGRPTTNGQPLDGPCTSNRKGKRA